MKYPMFLTFDIEDWFQVENLKGVINREEWDSKELRVKKNTQKILKILDQHNTKATFFILGWIAERVPELVKSIYDQGHEVASHGYGHQLVYNLTPKDFRKDIIKAKRILESIIDDRIYGYRAPSFSITKWALEILKDEGFIYDSSFFPSSMHDRYSKLNFSKQEKGLINTLKSGLKEINISTLNLFENNLPWGGGGYFRLLPYKIYKLGYKKSYQQNKGAIFYFHPWELDNNQPRIKNIKFIYKFRHYYGLDKAEKKLNSLVQDFNFISIEEHLVY